MAKIENVKRHIIRVLRKAEVYRPEMCYQIELLAADVIQWRKFLGESLDQPGTIVETRQYGSVVKVNPIHSMVQAQANQVRQDLKALLMNWEKRDGKSAGTAPDGDDLLAKIMSSGEGA